MKTHQMYESSSCEPCADEDGAQVHQLDRIAGRKKETQGNNHFKNLDQSVEQN